MQGVIYSCAHWVLTYRACNVYAVSRFISVSAR
jgi:hypothetical protein